MQKIIKTIKKSINYILGIFLISIFIFLTWHFIPPLITHDYKNCSNKYPLRMKYNNLSRTHHWEVYGKTFLEIESYIGDSKDGVSIYYNKDDKSIDVFTGVSQISSNKRNGVSFGYMNGTLRRISNYKRGITDGIYLTFHDTYPSLLEVYSDNKSLGIIGFWDYGRIRDIKFGSHYKDDTREGGKDNDTYDNGQKAFEYIEENGMKYWVVYNPKGQMLVKYPTDNNFCKAEFYENGKKVEIPYYFDQKEFEEIYEKIKNDVNKSNL